MTKEAMWEEKVRKYKYQDRKCLNTMNKVFFSNNFNILKG